MENIRNLSQVSGPRYELVTLIIRSRRLITLRRRLSVTSYLYPEVCPEVNTDSFVIKLL
jgi:hypothetical protein